MSVTEKESAVNGRQRVLQAAGLVGILLLLARVFGLLREIVIRSTLGFKTAEAVSFEIAARFPESIFLILAGGAIGAAFIGLKPGGVFVTSTACIGDMSWYFRLLVPVGPLLGLFPPVKVFTQAQLMQSLIDAGFEIDRDWLPRKNAAVYIVARKRDSKLEGLPGG